MPRIVENDNDPDEYERQVRELEKFLRSVRWKRVFLAVVIVAIGVAAGLVAMIRFL